MICANFLTMKYISNNKNLFSSQISTNSMNKFCRYGLLHIYLSLLISEMITDVPLYNYE
jgi:hypothetical protein